MSERMHGLHGDHINEFLEEKDLLEVIILLEAAIEDEKKQKHLLVRASNTHGASVPSEL